MGKKQSTHQPIHSSTYSLKLEQQIAQINWTQIKVDLRDFLFVFFLKT